MSERLVARPGAAIRHHSLGVTRERQWQTHGMPLEKSRAALAAGESVREDLKKLHDDVEAFRRRFAGALAKIRAFGSVLSDEMRGRRTAQSADWWQAQEAVGTLPRFVRDARNGEFKARKPRSAANATVSVNEVVAVTDVGPVSVITESGTRYNTPLTYRGRNVIERAFNGFKHFRGCIRRPMGDLLGRRHRRTRRTAASRGGCPSTADDQGKGEYPLLSTLNV